MSLSSCSTHTHANLYVKLQRKGAASWEKEKVAARTAAGSQRSGWAKEVPKSNNNLT